MKKLIIAEKPSLFMNVVKSLSKIERFERKDGYCESANFICTFAYGHLFTLKDVAEYSEDETYKKWNIEILPFRPDPFSFRLKKDKDGGVAKQFKIIEKLYSRSDVDQIVNCGDSDREGEIIIRIIADKIAEETGTRKIMKRLWLPEQTEDTIRSAIKDLQPDEKYDSLAQEGYARTYMDWLLGINLTRYITLKAGSNKPLPVGRVIIPIVKFIYDRDMAIRNHVPKKYYQVESNEKTNDEDVKLVIKDMIDMIDEASLIAEKVNKCQAIVKSIDAKEVKKQPGKLFSLTKIQNFMSSKYKISPKDTLAVIQKLYENGYVTYPRTNSEYMADTEKEKMQKILNTIDPAGEFLVFKDKKTVFDSSKVESHSAITTTTKVPDMEILSKAEQVVYTTIRNRIICNFLAEETIIEKTTMLIQAGEYEFKLTGNVVKQAGFLKYEPGPKESTLPKLNVGDVVNTNFVPVEKMTQPPKKITAEALNNFLENPYRKEEKEGDDEEYKMLLQGVEIGTVATRSGIIKNCIDYGYISEAKDIYSIEKMGETLINLLDQLQINLYKEKNVRFSMLLKKVNAGEVSIDVCCNYVEKELQTIVAAGRSIEVEQVKNEQPQREVIGRCPRCGKNIYESQKAFYCEGFRDDPKCDFSIFKNNKFFETKKKKLTKSMVSSMLKLGKVKVKGLYSAQKDKKYDATVCMEDTGKFVNFKLEF